MSGRTRRGYYGRAIVLLALVLETGGCGLFSGTSNSRESLPPLADLLLTTDDLDRLRPNVWTQSTEPLPGLEGEACGDECVAGLWSAPGGDIVLTLNRHPTTRSAASTYGQLVSVAGNDLNYVAESLPGDVELPEDTWLGVRTNDGPVTFSFYSQQGQYIVVILLATKYATLTDDQLQGFELILSDVAAAQLAKLAFDT